MFLFCGIQGISWVFPLSVDREYGNSVKDHIVICIITYRRTRMLQNLLKKIALQKTDGLFDFSLVVVDNEMTGTAEETVKEAASTLGLEITYQIGREQTIPAARNRALELARGNYIAIIDDDEFPPQDWLITMYRALQAFRVDGVLGPVLPFFERKPPAWLIKSGFCDRPIHRTGTMLYWHQTRSGNVLVGKEVFDKHDLKFDASFRTGGSDQEFFKQAMHKGCKFVAVEEAPVYEIVPPERWARSYYVKRAIVNGANAHKNISTEVGGLAWAVIAARSFAAVLVYTVTTPFSLLLGSHVLMNCLEKGLHHLSRLCAMAGIELIRSRNF